MAIIYGRCVISKNSALSKKLKLTVLLFLADNHLMKIFAMIVATLTFISCAKKKSLTDVSIDFNQFATSSNFSTILLYGVSQSGSTFTRILDSGYFSSQIPSDVWDFHAIVWEGTDGAFTGKSYCARALGVDLSRTEVDIDLSVSADNCDSYSNHDGDFFVNPIIKVLDVSNNLNCDIGSQNCFVTNFSIKYVVRESNNNNILDRRISSGCLEATRNTNIISRNLIKHRLIGAFKVFREGDCHPDFLAKTITIGSNSMTTIVDPNGSVTLYLKI